MPRRVATGVDPKRLAMIVAVLTRHARVALGAGRRLRQRRGRRPDRRARRRPRGRARDRLRRARRARARRRRPRSARSGSPAVSVPRRRPSAASRSARSSASGWSSPRRARPPVAHSRWRRRDAAKAIAGGARWPQSRRGRRASVGPSGGRARLHAQRPRRTIRAATRRCWPRSRGSRPGRRSGRRIDDVIRSREGALIVIGDPSELAFLYSGGIRLEQPFTAATSVRAGEDGRRDHRRHGDQAPRVGERPAHAGSDDPVRRDRDAPPHGRACREADGRARHLDVAAARDGDDLRRAPRDISSTRSRTCSRRRTRRWARSRRTRQRLEQVLTRLTALEFQNAVVLDDVLVVLQRAEMTARMADRIERATASELGCGRAADPACSSTSSSATFRRSATRSCATTTRTDPRRNATAALERLRGCSYRELLEFEPPRRPARLRPDGQSARLQRLPAGLPRALAHPAAARRDRSSGSSTASAPWTPIVRASQRDLEGVDGVGAVRAREIQGRAPPAPGAQPGGSVLAAVRHAEARPPARGGTVVQGERLGPGTGLQKPPESLEMCLF